VKQAILIRSNPVWRIGNLRGMSYEELDSVLTQTLAEPSCPSRLLLLETGENYTYQELLDSGIRKLIHNRIGG